MEKFRRGHVREDGKVFLRYLNGEEVWGTMKSFRQRQQTVRNYANKSRRLAKSLLKEQHSFGDYDFKNNLYFIGISSSGKPIWRNKDYFEKYKARAKANKRKYVQKCKQLELTNLKPGMQNPSNPKEYLLYKIGNKCFFGTLEEWEKRKETNRMAQLKLYFKYKKIRREKLDKLEFKRKRGDTRSQDNKIFFYYSENGNEIWLDPEEFHRRRNKEIEKKKIRRQNKKIKVVSSSIPLNLQPHEDSTSSNSTNDQI